MSKLKKIRVRPAKPSDRGLFKKLWKRLLEESFENGDIVLPTDSNVEFYAKLFDQYVDPTSKFKGVVLFVSDVAVLMWGDSGNGLELSIGNNITGWGIYVEPENRKKGISAALYAKVLDESVVLGFNSMVGGYRTSNPAKLFPFRKAVKLLDDGEIHELTTSICYEFPSP